MKGTVEIGLLTESDVGKQIHAQVGFYDDKGNWETDGLAYAVDVSPVGIGINNYAPSLEEIYVSVLTENPQVNSLL